jgi:hypothetical protein
MNYTRMYLMNAKYYLMSMNCVLCHLHIVGSIFHKQVSAP